MYATDNHNSITPEKGSCLDVVGFPCFAVIVFQVHEILQCLLWVCLLELRYFRAKLLRQFDRNVTREVHYLKVPECPLAAGPENRGVD
jgi:hypothetical protein